MTQRRHWLGIVATVLSGGLLPVAVAQPVDGRIGYVMTDLYWSIYQTPDGREECPQGFNDGPREQFAQRFPDPSATTVEDSQLAQEVVTWLHSGVEDSLPFHTVEGATSWGFNLDGRSDVDDFTHPDGTPGIDNQVYRAVGCIIGFRGPDGVEYIFQNKAIFDERYNRMMIELSGVDSLENDPEVTVSLYRGRDRLLTDATGERASPGGTQRIDYRWGRSLIRHTQGRIDDGVLTTVPLADMVMPWMNLSVPSTQRFRDLRFRLDLTAERAQGQMGGYADVDTWYYQLIRNDSTHHLSNGQISAISLYPALRRLADAYPDADGNFTAISTALDVKLIQTHILHDEPSK